MFDQLTDLFRASCAAHGQAHADSNGFDAEWPLRYASHLHAKLQELLYANLTKSELIYLLVLVDKEQKLKAPDADWPAYYAQFFMEHFKAR